MYPQEFCHTQHSLLPRRLVSAYFSAQIQTRKPERMKETIQIVYKH